MRFGSFVVAAMLLFTAFLGAAPEAHARERHADLPQIESELRAFAQIIEDQPFMVGWNKRALTTMAVASVMANQPPQKVLDLASEIYWNQFFVSRAWFWNDVTYGTLAAGALISKSTSEQALEALRDVYRARSALPGTIAWHEETYANLAFAVMLAKIKPEASIQMLADIYNQRIDFDADFGWPEDVYGILASAALVSGKSSQEALRALSAVAKIRNPQSAYMDLAARAYIAAGSLLTGVSVQDLMDRSVQLYELKKLPDEFSRSSYAMLAVMSYLLAAP